MYEKITEWLDTQVRLHQESLNSKYFSFEKPDGTVLWFSNTSAIDKGIHIFEIEGLCKIMKQEGYEITIKSREDDYDYPYEYSFMYGGVLFYGLSTVSEV